MTCVPSSSRRTDRIPAPLLAITAITSVQLGSGLARTLFDDLGPAGVTLLRLALSAATLLVVTRPAVRSWPRATWAAAGLLGVAMAGMNLVFYLAIQTVPLGIAVTVEFTGPLLLALVQTRRLPDVGWVLLAGAGVVLLGVRTTGGVALTGLALALVAGLFWAGYIVASARVGQLLPGTGGLAVALTVASLIVLPFGAHDAVSGVAAKPHLLLPAFGVACLSSMFSYGLEMTALRRIPTRVFGVLMSLEPGAAALAGLVVLGQRLGVREIAALVMVSAASAGITLTARASAARALERKEPTPVEP